MTKWEKKFDKLTTKLFTLGGLMSWQEKERELKSFIRQTIKSELAEFVKKVRLKKKILYYYPSPIEQGYNQAIDELNLKIKEALEGK